MVDKLDSLVKEVNSKISQISELKAVEDLQHEILGKKGKLTQILRGLSELPESERPLVGKKANEIKVEIQKLLDEKLLQLKQSSLSERLEKEWLDLTLPGDPVPSGRLHPLTRVLREVKTVFSGLGFEFVQGPEVETDYYNFEALNIPPDHPAREMWDSLYLGERTLLRTHTSPVQIRVMEKRKPPLRVISGGKCYRRDAVDSTHCFQFHQVEGFMVDKGVSMAHLKGTLSAFAQGIFGSERKVKLVPSYFPFTEPSVEVYIDCFNCALAPSESCRICGGSKWLEILGAGMIHPFVLRVVNIPSEFTGFAFGLGIERIAMLKFGIDDIRLFYESDQKFLEQF
ncbi:MAG: phenylalanine--tRNA ligase subunit alpha [Candidatus Eremiobacteraeota bacterium]|nr:phenylalanine--tRNA ligase subunit alpha [Candidatus Eremiobacteraeota bacterium]MCL5055537.1 phenylalanine--tRNA ligase subunit alpha [Bacillota bacterium]